MPLSDLAEAVEAIADNPTARVDLKGLPAAPDGFSDREVRAFALRAKDIIERGIDPDLQGSTPADAFASVFATQYPETTRQARADSERAAGGRYDWEWVWASLFETSPSRPAAILSSRWQVAAVDGGVLADGTPAPQLEVILTADIEHLVPSGASRTSGDPAPGAELVPIVLHRSVIVRGFKPLGGPDWWPAIGMQADPLFGGKCAPKNGSVLTPARDKTVLAADLRQLRTYIERPNAIDASASSDAADLTGYLERYCKE